MAITRTAWTDDDGSGTTGTVINNAEKTTLYGQIDAAIDGADATTRTVAKGGTGATTLTAHGVVLGNGTSAVAITAAGTSGQVLTSNGASADPTFQAVPIDTVDVGLCQGRLTLTTAVPVTTADVTAATTLRFALYGGNLIALYSGSAWALFTFPELSIAVPATTSQMYDVFVYDNAGTRTLEVLAWTNDTTRATALVLQDGVLCKTGVLTRRYVGSFRTTTVSGQTEDSAAKRYVWNYYNRVRRPLVRQETTDTWNYTTATLRQAIASTANQVEIVVGVAEVLLELDLRVVALNTNAAVQIVVAIGEDSTTVALAISTGGLILWAWTPAANTYVIPSSTVRKMPAIGRHFYAWLEYSAATGTTTFIGDNGSPLISQSGLVGSIEG